MCFCHDGTCQMAHSSLMPRKEGLGSISEALNNVSPCKRRWIFQTLGIGMVQPDCGLISMLDYQRDPSLISGKKLVQIAYQGDVRQNREVKVV